MSNRKQHAKDIRKITFVPLNKLKKSPKNVRKVPHTETEIEAIAASIASLGLLQFPIIEPEHNERDKPTGFYLVNAGEGRRLAQLLRAQRKEIKKVEPIPCILDTEHNATEISLAENAVRSNMHPADQYEAFAALQKQDMGIEDIAARFGVSPAIVKQRLKLSAVSPALLNLYREDGMSLEQLTAFTVTDDHARQEEVWDTLGYDDSREAILRVLTEGKVSAKDRRVTFVGIGAYEAAGGIIIRDLFDEQGRYLQDAALLNRLVREKLQTFAEKVMAEGWKWVEVNPEFDYSRAHAMTTISTVSKVLTASEQQSLDDLQQRLETLNNEADDDDDSGTLEEIESLEEQIASLTEGGYAPDDMARAGAFVSLGGNGEARIERGYVRPEDKVQQGTERDDAQEDTAEKSSGLSMSLTAELTAHRTAGLINDLGQAPELALIAVMHALALKAFYTGDTFSCLGLSLERASLQRHAPNIDDAPAMQAITMRHAAWAERMPDDGEALWPFVSNLTMTDLMALLAHCASLSLDAIRTGNPGYRAKALAHADILAKALPHDMNGYWRPTTSSYLGRVGKELILDAVREAVGDEAVHRLSGLKKQAMALRAEQLLEGCGWLPAVLKPSQDTHQAAV